MYELIARENHYYSRDGENRCGIPESTNVLYYIIPLLILHIAKYTYPTLSFKNYIFFYVKNLFFHLLYIVNENALQNGQRNIYSIRK